MSDSKNSHINLFKSLRVFDSIEGEGVLKNKKKANKEEDDDKYTFLVLESRYIPP